MVSKSDDIPILKFLEKLMFFFSKNGLNIRWPAHFELQKKSSYLEEWNSAGSQFLSFFRSSVDLRFRTSAVPKNLETILAFITPFPARLVLWKYSMHVFVTYFFET